MRHSGIAGIRDSWVTVQACSLGKGRARASLSQRRSLCGGNIRVCIKVCTGVHRASGRRASDYNRMRDQVLECGGHMRKRWRHGFRLGHLAIMHS